MAKNKILSGKYRIPGEDDSKRLNLYHCQKGDNPPYLELHNGKKEPIAIYTPSYNNNDNSNINPSDYRNLESNLIKLKKKLTESSVFPPDFLDELNKKLKERNWKISE